MNGWIDLRDILPSSGEYARRNLEDIDTVVIHHSDTPPNTEPKAIAEYHLSRGWPKVGYHFLIGPRGETWWANDLEARSHHVEGHNNYTIGICLIGSFMEGREPTDAQIEATRNLATELRGMVAIARVVGHHELAPTDCPGETFLSSWKAKMLEVRHMTTKLGVQIQHWVNPEGMVQFFEIAQPPVAKSIDDEPDRIRACKAVSPGTIWIGRAYTEDQDVSDPRKAARRHYERIMRKAMVRDVDCWEGFNEPNQWDHIRVSEFECHLADLLHAEGLKYAAYSWSVGVPRLEIWRDSIVLEAMRTADYYSRHEYLAPSLWDIRGFDPPYADREEYITSGWFTLRYRKEFEILSQYLLPSEMPAFLITECGIDSGASHWDPGAQGGWRSFTDPAGYIQQLAWNDRQWCMDDYLIGATIFTFGTRDPTWSTYDCWHPESMRIALRQYLVASQTGGKTFEERLAEAAQEHVIPFVPDNYFRRVGLARGWEAISDEHDFEGFRYQAFVVEEEGVWQQKIIYSPIGDWESWKVITRPN